MLTGEIRNQVDRVWDDFWSGGISNPLEVIEQLTYNEAMELAYFGLVPEAVGSGLGCIILGVHW